MFRRSCARCSVVDFLQTNPARGEKFSLLRPPGADAPLKKYQGALIPPDPILERTCVRDWVFPICDNSFGSKATKNAILLIGNPGIGKSCALNAIAAYLIGTIGQGNDLHILFGKSLTSMRHIYKVENEWFSAMLTTEELRQLVEENTNPSQPNWVWLQDTPQRDQLPPFVFGAMLNVLASSPNQNNYSVWADKMIANGCAIRRVYLPVWSWEEIECGAKFCNVQEWATKERFDKYGGIPRQLFSPPSLDEEEFIQKAVKQFDVDAFVKTEGNMPNNQRGSASHRLIQLIPGDKGVGFTRDWITPYVARLIRNRQDSNNYREVMQFARWNCHGQALENAVIAEIQRLGVIHASLLKADGTTGNVVDFVIPKKIVDFKTASEFLAEKSRCLRFRSKRIIRLWIALFTPGRNFMAYKLRTHASTTKLTSQCAK